MYEYPATIKRVIDGDTYVVDIDLGFGVSFTEKVRLYNVDTPETYGVKKDSEEYKRGIEAKQFVEDRLIAKNKDHEVVIETIKDRKGKYGRYLAIVWYKIEKGSDWTNLNKELVTEGHVK